MLYPLTFEPILKERVWGGRELERLYGKHLPPNIPVGESWEITDRLEGVSVIANGELAGMSLRWLMEHHAEGLLGHSKALNGRFPLLCKILDAREKLSLQVHPPTEIAGELGGEPKTEAWYVAQAADDAELFVGLKRGASRQEFERRLADGSVAECFHRHRVKRGDVMFLPSGRVHALGAGNVIFEIQQNSDTTYRVFDWNRLGTDGKPRELHVDQALQCIDFGDFEPGLVKQVPGCEAVDWERSPLVDAREFRLDLWRCLGPEPWVSVSSGCRVVAVVEGHCTIGHSSHVLELLTGQLGLLPAVTGSVAIGASTGCVLLVAQPA